MELPMFDCELEIRPPRIDKAAAEQSPSRGIELPKDVTPDRLRVPKALKYTERYRSPTDMMVSPITRGLIARTRRNGGALLPSSLLIIDQPKVVSGRAGSLVSSSLSPRTQTAMPVTRLPIMSQRRMTVSWMLRFCQGSPPIGASSPSMLKRPAGYDPNRIPSSTFSSRPSNPTDWSVASNKSLFSIHAGNYRKPEPAVRQPQLICKSSDKGHLSPSGDARNSVSLSAQSDGSTTTTTTSSFAFPILAGSKRNSSSLYKMDGALERPKEAPPKTLLPQQQNHRTTVRAALSNCFSYFSCCSFCCNFSLK